MINTTEEKISDELSSIGLDTIKEVRSKKFLIPVFLAAICLVVLIFYLTSVFPIIKSAESAGRIAGETGGRTVGMAVGSVEGATQGLQVGYSDGKEDALSAEDTVVTIASSLESNVRSLGFFEVLAANVDLTIHHEVGNKYAALYLLRGQAVFTIDMSKVSVTYNKDLISIVIPRPEATITIDPSETSLIKDRQSVFSNGSDSEGFTAYLNTLTETKSYSEKQVVNYSALMELASESAIRQIEELANVARANKEIAVTVSILSN